MRTRATDLLRPGAAAMVLALGLGTARGLVQEPAAPGDAPPPPALDPPEDTPRGQGPLTAETAQSAEPETLAQAVARISALERENAELRATLERERAVWLAREEGLRRDIHGLQAELVRLTEDRVNQEQQWVDFAKLIASVSSDAVRPEVIERLLQGPGGPPPTPIEPAQAEDADAEGAGGLAVEPQPEADRYSPRDREVLRVMRSMFVAEQVNGVDLLEAGHVHEGATGPVVLQLRDERGRPAGTLSADRLRLQASRAGRTLTIVLEHGYERRAGQRTPFEGTLPGEERGGERRIVLHRVDPRPWIEALPELFTIETLDETIDDGDWNTTLVQRALNVLLLHDAAAGYYRLAALGGVKEGRLRDVQLEHRDANDRLLRRLFADRLSIHVQTRGVLLILEDGVQVRGGRKLAFLDGLYRIFLPNASAADWLEMGLPGLCEAEESALARESQRPLPRALRK